jgi:hypothetical protein
LLEIFEDVLAPRGPDGHIRLASLPVAAIRTVQAVVGIKSKAEGIGSKASTALLSTSRFHMEL